MSLVSKLTLTRTRYAIMKRFVFALLPLVALLAVGCQGGGRNSRCPQCQQTGGGRLADGLVSGRYARGMNEPAEDPGPAAAAVAYPYYTMRGPRDFLQNNPPSIGR